MASEVDHLKKELDYALIQVSVDLGDAYDDLESAIHAVIAHLEERLSVEIRQTQEINNWYQAEQREHAQSRKTVGALNRQLSECQSREKVLREACEAADTHVAIESIVFPSPIFWDDIQKIKTQLSAALEVKK